MGQGHGQCWSRSYWPDRIGQVCQMSGSKEKRVICWGGREQFTETGKKIKECAISQISLNREMIYELGEMLYYPL